MNKRLKITALEKYLYIDCRVILLHSIGTDYNSFAFKHGINTASVRNFVKWNYYDYLEYGTDKQHRYLSINNCFHILELSGYKIELSLKLADNED